MLTVKGPELQHLARALGEHDLLPKPEPRVKPHRSWEHAVGTRSLRPFFRACAHVAAQEDNGIDVEFNPRYQESYAWTFRMLHQVPGDQVVDIRIYTFARYVAGRPAEMVAVFTRYYGCPHLFCTALHALVNDLVQHLWEEHEPLRGVLRLAPYAAKLGDDEEEKQGEEDRRHLEAYRPTEEDVSRAQEYLARDVPLHGLEVCRSMLCNEHARAAVASSLVPSLVGSIATRFLALPSSDVATEEGDTCEVVRRCLVVLRLLAPHLGTSAAADTAAAVRAALESPRNHMLEFDAVRRLAGDILVDLVGARGGK